MPFFGNAVVFVALKVDIFSPYFSSHSLKIKLENSLTFQVYLAYYIAKNMVQKKLKKSRWFSFTWASYQFFQSSVR